MKKILTSIIAILAVGLIASTASAQEYDLVILNGRVAEPQQ